jgi:hypothetical protein
MTSTVLLTHEAHACHRFSRWYYPWPQRCYAAHSYVPHKKIEDRSWFVEIKFPEAKDNDPEREKALAKLRDLMK